MVFYAIVARLDPAQKRPQVAVISPFSVFFQALLLATKPTRGFLLLLIMKIDYFVFVKVIDITLPPTHCSVPSYWANLWFSFDKAMSLGKLSILCYLLAVHCMKLRRGFLAFTFHFLCTTKCENVSFKYRMNGVYIFGKVENFIWSPLVIFLIKHDNLLSS